MGLIWDAIPRPDEVEVEGKGGGGGEEEVGGGETRYWIFGIQLGLPPSSAEPVLLSQHLAHDQTQKYIPQILLPPV